MPKQENPQHDSMEEEDEIEQWSDAAYLSNVLGFNDERIDPDTETAGKCK
jgi:hypothetical protein